MIQYGKLISTKTSQEDREKQIRKIKKSIKLLSESKNLPDSFITSEYKKLQRLSQNNKKLMQNQYFSELYKIIKNLYVQYITTNMNINRNSITIENIVLVTNHFCTNTSEELKYFLKIHKEYGNIINKLYINLSDLISMTLPDSKAIFKIKSNSYINVYYNINNYYIDIYSMFCENKSWKYVYNKIKEIEQKILSAYKNYIIDSLKYTISNNPVFDDVFEQKVGCIILNEDYQYVTHGEVFTLKNWREEGMIIYDKQSNSKRRYMSYTFISYLIKYITEKHEKEYVYIRESGLRHNKTYNFLVYHDFLLSTEKRVRLNDKYIEKIKEYTGKYGTEYVLCKIVNVTQKSIWCIPIDVIKLVFGDDVQ